MAAKVTVVKENGEYELLGYSYDQQTHYSLLELAARKTDAVAVIVELVENGRLEVSRN